MSATPSAADTDLPPIYPGNFRATCQWCPWWREVPALGLDALIRESNEHRATHEEASCR